jgi:hypothetical protein
VKVCRIGSGSATRTVRGPRVKSATRRHLRRLLVVAHVDVPPARGVPAVAPRLVLRRVGGDDDRVAVEREVAVGERDVALEHGAGSERAVRAALEDDDREPRRIAIRVAAHEGEHEVEHAVVVRVAADEVRVVDAVQVRDVAVLARGALVSVLRHAQVGVRSEVALDRGSLGGSEVVTAPSACARGCGLPGVNVHPAPPPGAAGSAVVVVVVSFRHDVAAITAMTAPHTVSSDTSAANTAARGEIERMSHARSCWAPVSDSTAARTPETVYEIIRQLPFIEEEFMLSWPQDFPPTSSSCCAGSTFCPASPGSECCTGSTSST